MRTDLAELHALVQKWRDRAKEKIATGSIDMFALADGMRDCASDLAALLRKMEPSHFVRFNDGQHVVFGDAESTRAVLAVILKAEGFPFAESAPAPSGVTDSFVYSVAGSLIEAGWISPAGKAGTVRAALEAALAAEQKEGK